MSTPFDNIPFIKGLDLSQRYFEEVVRPILAKSFPEMTYSAARLDAGSDVLGFDTPQSRDHDWGPRVILFLEATDRLGRDQEAVMDVLRRRLPVEFLGYPTHFEAHPDGTLGMKAIGEGPVEPLIKITTVEKFFLDYLAFRPTGPPAVADWMTFPEQRLATVRSGRVFMDGSGRLKAIQNWLDYYPKDFWLYLLAVQWRRIDQEEAFIGRSGDVGDELGSHVIASRQIENVMKLAFLMEKQYAPYSKWFGSAFARLACATKLMPMFEDALVARNWQDRQKAFSKVYEFMARWHNETGLTEAQPERVSHFHGRPYLVIHAANFVDALRGAIEDEAVRSLPAHLGAIDQVVDSVDVLAYPERFKLFRKLFKPLANN